MNKIEGVESQHLNGLITQRCFNRWRYIGIIAFQIDLTNDIHAVVGEHFVHMLTFPQGIQGFSEFGYSGFQITGLELLYVVTSSASHG